MRMRRFMKRFHKGQKGFTLIELLIVVAILGVLAAVVIPNIGTFMTSGKVGAANAELRSVELSVDGMMADAGTMTITGATGWDGTGTSTPTVTVGGVTYNASNYLNLKGTTLTGTYNVDTAGVVAGNTYAGLTWDSTNRRWKAA